MTVKPIRLKIKGLNSFMESQEVDFEKLTSKGLFGIFGSTGSGKSTILDGITLALYGEVARKSSNYINTNCDSLNVSFEFQITGKEIKGYRVERGFKREAKTGNVRSKSAKIIDITDGLEEILEEGTKLVTEKCEEIIGLQLEDFTRTVVLPQGKFSEFLKLEGKDRRNMLERLFNLGKYGDELSFKLAHKIKNEKEKSSILKGELIGFENVSETILEVKMKELVATKEGCDKSHIELNEAENNFNKGKELWDLQDELKNQMNKEKELKGQEAQINKNQSKVTLGESALKVKPYIDGYENTLGQIIEVNSEVLGLTAKVEIIKESKLKSEDELDIAKNRKDKELPELRLREQKVKEAIDEKVVLNALVKEKSTLKNIIVKVEESLKNIIEQTKKNEKGINNINNNISEKEENIETLKISEEYKKKVNEGVVILSSYESLISQKDNSEKNIKATTQTINKATEESKNLSGYLKEKQNLSLKSTEALTALLNVCPGDENALLNLQERLTVVKDNWNKYNEYNGNLNKSNNLIEVLRKKLRDNEIEKKTLDQEINEIKEKISKFEIENLAHTLRSSLLDGEPCPVCGSQSHCKNDVELVDTSNLEQLKLDLINKEQKNKELTETIIKEETTSSSEKLNRSEKQEQISALGETFKLNSVETVQTEFNKLKLDVSHFNAKKTNLETEIKILTKDENILDNKNTQQSTIIIENSSLLQRLQSELNEIEQKLEKTNKELLSLKAELSIEDFKIASAKIIKKEKEKNALESEIKLLRSSLKEEVQQNEKLNKNAGEFREELSEKKSTLIEKNKSIEEKEKAIKNKAGDVEDLDKLKEEIINVIKKIEVDYVKAEEYKKQVEDQFNVCNNSILAAKGKLLILSERITNDKEKLENALLDEGFKDIDETKRNFIIKSEIVNLKIQIEEYKSSLTKLEGTIESLNKKIGDRSLTQEQWTEIQFIKTEKNQRLKELEKTKIELEAKVKSLVEKLAELIELLEKKEKLDHKLSILDDLEKLFKGKKFVEFVATNQLKYVSIEACKRLKEITGDNYGLEIDENGKFLIRDNKNGGALRDASTLSGGETFLVSLSLALALSAQIQLKGVAPLELFFLDEGFGTLDDNMLEVVMDSLERIHNDKLSIGIISHVESIKNRVPMKLIVTAAEAGMGGSKVRVEIS